MQKKAALGRRHALPAMAMAYVGRGREPQDRPRPYPLLRIARNAGRRPMRAGGVRSCWAGDLATALLIILLSLGVDASLTLAVTMPMPAAMQDTPGQMIKAKMGRSTTGGRGRPPVALSNVR